MVSLFSLSRSHAGACAPASRDVAERMAAEIGEAGGRAIFVPLEASDLAQWEAAAKATTDAFGSLDILVNNAGTNEACSPPHIDFDQWDKVMDINVKGPLMGMQVCAPIMREHGGGSIVNIASLAGMLGTPSTAYSTSKWALRGLSKSAASSFCNWGVRVNTIDPGFTGGTNMADAIAGAAGSNPVMRKTLAKKGNPLAGESLAGREGKVVKIAAAALSLAGDDSS